MVYCHHLQLLQKNLKDSIDYSHNDAKDQFLIFDGLQDDFSRELTFFYSEERILGITPD